MAFAMPSCLEFLIDSLERCQGSNPEPDFLGATGLAES
jgi:hypothetical protein